MRPRAGIQYKGSVADPCGLEDELDLAGRAGGDAGEIVVGVRAVSHIVQAVDHIVQVALEHIGDLLNALFVELLHAVAQLARESFHGSSTSDVLDFVTDSTTADDFVNKMQSQAAVTRSESNAATDAANELNTSMNRKDRLGAIEQKITQLKEQADQQAASAQRGQRQADRPAEAA